MGGRGSTSPKQAAPNKKKGGGNLIGMLLREWVEMS